MRYSLLALLLILIALPCSIRGEEEEPYGFPPFTGWDDVEDITDKVIAWDVPFAKVEKYSLLDPNIPDLPDPHPMCFAPPEYDSYEGRTRKYPKQCGYEKSGASMETVSGLLSGSSYFDYDLFYSISSFRKHIAFKRKIAPNEEYIEPQYETRAAQIAIDKFTEENGRMMSCCISPRVFHFIKEKPTNTWGVKIVDTFYIVKSTKEGVLSVTEEESLKGFEFMGRFSWEPEYNRTGLTILYKDNCLYTISIDGLSKPIPFKPDLRFDTNIWHPLSFFSWENYNMPTPIRAYPIVPFCEKNYGYPKGAEMPPISYDPEAGRHNTFERDCWFEKQKIRPDYYNSNIILFNLSTGKSNLTLDGVHTLIQVDSNYVVMKNIAMSGKWHLTGIRDNKVVFNLPLSSISAKDLRHIYCYDGRYLVAVYPCLTVMVDFVEMQMVRFHHLNAIEEEGMHKYMKMMYFEHIFVSRPFDNDGIKCRRVWSISRNTCMTKLSFIIPDPYINGRQRMPPIWYDKGHYLLYSGEKYLMLRGGKI